MRNLFIIALSLLLAACQTAKLDVALQKNLPVICRTAGNLHVAFLAATQSGSIPQKTIVKEAAGYQALQAFCADPSSVTSQTALIAAAEAYATYVIAVKGH